MRYENIFFITIICFSEHTEFIELNTNKDTTRTSFSILKKGFETKEQRKRAIEEWKARPTQVPVFSINYFSSKKPETITSIGVAACATVLTLKEFRLNEFKFPEGVGGNHVIFFKKLSDNKFFKGEAILMAAE